MIGRLVLWLIRDLARDCPELVYGSLASVAISASLAQDGES